MMRRRWLHLAAVAALAALPGLAIGQEAPPASACHFGAYRFADGSHLVIDSSDEPNLRYRRMDGVSGKLFRVDEGRYEGGAGWAVREPVTVKAHLDACSEGRLAMQQGAGPVMEARRVPLPTHPITFQSGAERLYGELVLPAEGPPRAVVVLQYGSGRESAVYNNYVQHLLPLKGVGVFVFDKRGTGRSTGGYSADFPVLADDMAAAIDAVRARPELAGIPLGVMGESQGGWVAPLAANRRPVDFVVVSYGLAVSPVEEDRSEVAASVRAFGPVALARAQALHDAATRVVASRFREGLPELERLKALNAQEPWIANIGGDYTSLLVATPAADIGKVRAAFDFPIDFTYEPRPALAGLWAPSLWILAGRDTEAPHESTRAVLRQLHAQGSPIDIAIFPQADHGMIEREAGRVSPGYYDLLADWISTRRLTRTYGDAKLIPRR
ncbi:alpha/beta hydrolase [Phenylobacterium sp. RIFCSPHIGHO2_01_FULL_69_31]|uniref:alpha/beta hydrolase family protein n=1 Tax=Phenylobacterium sp. RIFCSPHIGHO2_01_FULL_69_31 TaxID=1801944 RepID=UPI0025E7230C|nr:alpha/beta hydrolase [Phenylobacterium sp. RIFCSPHIGHO2_01_FULL_69_31]